MKKSEQVSEKTPTANRQYKDAVFRERKSLIPVQRSDRKPLSECGSP